MTNIVVMLGLSYY